jgi:hypothetical protein
MNKRVLKKKTSKPKYLEYSFTFEGLDAKKLTYLINYILKKYNVRYVETRDFTASISLMNFSIGGVKRQQIVFHVANEELLEKKCEYCNFPINDGVLKPKGSYFQCMCCTKNIKPILGSKLFKE